MQCVLSVLHSTARWAKPFHLLAGKSSILRSRLLSFQLALALMTHKLFSIAHPLVRRRCENVNIAVVYSEVFD